MGTLTLLCRPHLPPTPISFLVLTKTLIAECISVGGILFSIKQFTCPSAAVSTSAPWEKFMWRLQTVQTTKPLYKNNKVLWRSRRALQSYRIRTLAPRTGSGGPFLLFQPLCIYIALKNCRFKWLANIAKSSDSLPRAFIIHASHNSVCLGYSLSCG